MNKKMMKHGGDIENVGIMQGFMDSMDEGDEGEDDEDEGNEVPEKLMDRRPNSPEILMNNLRGDMRSIDARRDELADLVGYKAAKETPDQVLAMLQPVLAQQGGGGIGALPQSADMAQGPQPPMMGGAPGMPPPGMPPMPPGAGAPPPPEQGGIAELMAGMGMGGAGGPPPGMPPMPPGAGAPPPGPPMAMAKGGYVQNFQVGSSEEGVTQTDQTPSDDLMTYPTDMVAAARKASMGLLSQAPAVAPTLTSAMKSRLPEYQSLMGADKGAAEAQMLFDLGQRAFGFAANTDEAGRPLRGSFMSRLAGAAKTLPAAMGKRIDEINKIDRQIKALALQQGEKDIDQVVAQNTELQKRKGSLVAEVMRAQSRVDAKKAGAVAPGPLGKGSKGDILNNIIQYAPLYQSGALTPTQENAFMTAVTDYTQPTTIESTDPETGLKSLRTQRNQLPSFVSEALNARRPGSAPTPTTISTIGGGAPAATSTVGGGGAAVPTLGATERTVPKDVFQAASVAPKSSFFDLAATGTGFVPVLVAGVARNVPLDVAGRVGPEFQQSTAMLDSMTNRVVNTLQENPRFAEGERKQILSELKIAPRLFSNKSSYMNQIIALDNVIEGIENKTKGILQQPKTGITARQEATKKLEEIGAVRDLLGIKTRIITDPEVWKTLPPGEYVVVNPQTGFKEVRPKNDAAVR